MLQPKTKIRTDGDRKIHHEKKQKNNDTCWVPVLGVGKINPYHFGKEL
jgi:hypothetical protein